MSRLERLGYSEFFDEQFRKLSFEGKPGRVVGQHRREWDVAMESGTERAVLAGKRWAPSGGADAADAQPTIGDWVAVSDGRPPVIEHVLTRRTWLTRTSQAKRGARQVLAANIDYLAVVAAFAHPDADDFASKRSLSPRRIERYLTAIKKGGADALVLLNKADLMSDAMSSARQLESRLGSCPVVPVSCKEEGGLDPLANKLSPGQTIGLIGLSGVGKSSIVNGLLGRAAQKVGEERVSDARGRHTTTHRELFLADAGFILIDTPGMREFALVGADEADLKAFEDIVELSKNCSFRDCNHTAEPGCAVQTAVGRGELDQDRLESYRALAEELAEADRKKPVRRAGGKRRKYPERNSRSWDDD